MNPSQFPWIMPASALAGFFVSLWMEILARPRCASFHRPMFSWLLHAGLFLGAWGCALALFCRPVFAILAVLAGQFLVVQINNAKYRALREPFIFSDFGIFSQALKHPRLYFPFLESAGLFWPGWQYAAQRALGFGLNLRWNFIFIGRAGSLLRGLRFCSLD